MHPLSEGQIKCFFFLLETQRLPVMTACTNTTAVTETSLLSLHEHLGGVMQIFPHCDVDMWGVFEWAVLEERGRVLTISVVLRL